MMTLLFWLALIILLLTIAMSLEVAVGMRRMTNIRDVLPLQHEDIPRVSVIIPACNEAVTIEPALQSVLELDYANLEIIVVNDRSIDNTDAVLERMKTRYPNIILHNISELPKGWMGKSHALYSGAGQAHGDYLLFTDADIIMEKTTLSRAMHHMLDNKLDHMSLFFGSIAQGGLLNTLFMDAGIGLMLLFKPWKAKDKNSNKYMGAGAFNLVRASAYRAIDGHSTFAMHPIDDIMLGKVLKQRGFSQDFLFGHDFVQIEWYATIREYINGVMKNTFALYQFNVMKVLLGILFIIMFNVLPLWALFFTSGITRVLFGAAVLVRILLAVNIFLEAKMPPWYSVWALVTPYINIYIVAKAAITTMLNKGITWRGTYYPLDELKAGVKET